MSEVGGIEKSRSGTGISYKFRGIEDVFTNFHPLLIKNNVFCAPKVIKESTDTFQNKSGNTSFRVTLTVEHIFYADDGSNVSVTTCGEGIDTSDKATNKAMSAAFKYAFFELFCVPTAQVEDSDYSNPSIDAQAPQKENSWSMKQFQPTKEEIGVSDGVYRVPFGKYNKRSLHEIDMKDLENYVLYLENKAAKDGKEITGVVKEFIDNAVNFINTFEQEVSFNQTKF